MGLKIKPFRELRAQMIRKGYTQSQLGKAVGLTHSSINRKLNGKSPFNLPECIRIARVLNSTMDKLFGDDDAF